MATVIDEKNKVYAGTHKVDSDPLQIVGEDFVVTYYVKADNVNESLDDVLNATNMPKMKSNRDSSYLIRKYGREINAAALLWEVDCYYEQHTDVNSVTAEYGEKRKLDYRWSSESIYEVILEDPVTGKPIQNSVGEPFIVEAPIAIPVLSITKIYPYFSYLDILKYMNKTNSQEFWGAPPGVVLMADIRDEPFEISGFLWRKVHFTLKFNLRVTKDGQGDQEFIGWRAHLRNRGTYYYLDAAKSGKQKFRVDNKDVITGDLNLDGTKREEGADPLFLLFNKFPRESFTGLQINPP